MRFLLIGGTGFIGPPLARELQRLGHTVAVFHRGKNDTSLETVESIIGDRDQLNEHKEQFRRFAPDVVIDLILSSGPQAEILMATFQGIAKRVVAISSMDVYRAAGILHGTEPGPLEPLPLTEDSRLRQNLNVYPPETLKILQTVFAWVNDAYDKIPVERAVLSNPDFPATILRLPMVYGPGDHLHRLFSLLKRIQDGRSKILYSAEMAAWRWSRGYVENVAAAIALAACAKQAAGRIYNVCEEPALSELGWAKKIAEHAGWHGEFVILPWERTPKHLLPPGNTAQHWVASSERIRRELGFSESVSTEDGIRRTIAWELQNPPEINFRQFDYAAEDKAMTDSAA
jgi:nucleoside-diphosphate-sugar epimerase